MRFPEVVLRIAGAVCRPALFGGAVVSAFLLFAGAAAHAACTVGGGAAIDGFAVGASVNCPTGTVLAGTVPPDGSTITNKNVAGSTTFTYTPPGGGVGTVQLQGTVNLTAATGTPTTDVGAAAVANNNAQVEALFGGGNGGPTATEVSVDTGAVFGPAAPNPADVRELNRAQTLLSDLTDRQTALEAEIRVGIAALSTLVNGDKSVAENRQIIAALNAELEALQNPPPPDPSLSPGEVEGLEAANQTAIAEKLAEIEAAEAKAAADERDLLIAIGGLESDVEEREAELDRVQSELNRTRQRIEGLNENLRSGRGSGASQIAPLFQRDRSRGREGGAFGAFAASFRLSQLLLQARNTRLGQTETDQPLFRRPPEFPSALDMFANISYSDVANDANGAGYESKSWQGTVGLDYRLSDAWALGVFTAFTSNTSRTATINSSSESFSYLVGPFVRFNPTPNITVSASVSAGSTDTDLNVAGATSSFDSTQQLVTVAIRGSWRDGNWTFAPAGGISYSVTRSDGFTDSDGNVNGASTNRSGAINIGPTISYLYTLLDSGPVASVTPMLGINGTYNYKHSGDVTFNNGVILTSDDLSASLSPGVSVGFTNGSSASVGYTRSGIFSDVDGWSLTAGASAPLSLILPNLGPGATTGFQFTAEPQAGPTFMARLVIPLF